MYHEPLLRRYERDGKLMLPTRDSLKNLPFCSDYYFLEPKLVTRDEEYYRKATYSNLVQPVQHLTS
jgi:hypothetical protein